MRFIKTIIVTLSILVTYAHASTDTEEKSLIHNRMSIDEFVTKITSLLIVSGENEGAYDWEKSEFHILQNPRGHIISEYYFNVTVWSILTLDARMKNFGFFHEEKWTNQHRLQIIQRLNSLKSSSDENEKAWAHERFDYTCVLFHSLAQDSSITALEVLEASSNGGSIQDLTCENNNLGRFLEITIQGCEESGECDPIEFLNFKTALATYKKWARPSLTLKKVLGKKIIYTPTTDIRITFLNGTEPCPKSEIIDGIENDLLRHVKTPPKSAAATSIIRIDQQCTVLIDVKRPDTKNMQIILQTLNKALTHQ